MIGGSVYLIAMLGLRRALTGAAQRLNTHPKRRDLRQLRGTVHANQSTGHALKQVRGSLCYTLSWRNNRLATKQRFLPKDNLAAMHCISPAFLILGECA